MSGIVNRPQVAEAATLKMLKAAVGEARRLDAPSGIAIVDATGAVRAWVLMDGATPIAFEVVTKKARTAAFTGQPSGGMDGELAGKLSAAATDFVNLPGGYPVIVDGQVAGAIAAGSQSYEYDTAIAEAGLKAFAEA